MIDSSRCDFSVVAEVGSAECGVRKDGSHGDCGQCPSRDLHVSCGLEGQPLPHSPRKSRVRRLAASNFFCCDDVADGTDILPRILLEILFQKKKRFLLEKLPEFYREGKTRFGLGV